MGNTGKDPELKALEARLNEARKKATPEPERENGNSSAMGMAFKIGIQLVGAVVVGVLIGLTLDKWLATPPLFLFVFMMLGFAAGLRDVVREARKMQADETEPKD